MDYNLSEQKKIEALNKEYKVYIEKLRRDWVPRNQVDSNRVYEVMYPHERAKVQENISAWSRYITPFAESWWKERGYGIVWPEDDSNPIQLYKLEA